jgi:subfamily B ATP-binding cassette protein MsbA
MAKGSEVLTGKARLRLLALLRSHASALTLGALAVVGEGVANLAEPWPLKIVLDNVLRAKPAKGWLNDFVVGIAGTDRLAILEFCAVAVLMIATVGAVCSYFEKRITASVSQWVSHDLRRTLYFHVQSLSVSYHDQKRTGDLLSRATSDIDAIQSFISGNLLSSVTDILTLAGMITVMFFLNWQFTLIALSVAPPLAIIVYTYTRRIKSASRDLRKQEGEIASVMEEALTSMRLVKTFAREDYEQQRMEEQSLATVEIALRARGLKAKLAPIVEVIVAIGTALVLWYGGRLALSGELSTGSLVVFIYYLGKMYKPMQDLSKMTDALSKAAVGHERILEVLETRAKVKDLVGARTAPRFHGTIEFRDVSFSYDGQTPTLRDVNLRIQPGQIAAFVGPTGSGKTTIVSLISRLYDPNAGSVSIDGRDVRGFTQKSLRQQMSYVLQETVLFHGTVWRNIAYGRPEATRSEILRAAELANAKEFIDKMPDGYDTIIGERGVTLSGGQRQRIAIARAIIRNSPILILDEPTSGLDTATEALVFEALDRLMEGKTCIVIAHRLSTIERADVIFVVKDGQIVERGRHQELLDRGGVYNELHEARLHTAVS